MPPSTLILDILAYAVVACFVAGFIGVVWLAARALRQPPQKRVPPPGGALPAARPPNRTPTEGDKILARLINAVDHDMRSIELGNWFLAEINRLRVPCDAGVRSAELLAIARRVPGANSVTQSELYGHLTDLVNELCRGGAARSAFASRVSSLRATALSAGGLLLGMPGYSAKSNRPLP